MPVNTKKNREIAKHQTIENIIEYFDTQSDLKLITNKYDGNPDTLIEYLIISRNIIMKTKWIGILNGYKPWINGYDFFREKSINNIIKSFEDKNCEIINFTFKNEIVDIGTLMKLSPNVVFKSYTCIYKYEDETYTVSLHRWLYGSLPHIERKGTKFKLSTIKKFFENEQLEYISGYKDMHSIVSYKLTKENTNYDEKYKDVIYKVELGHFVYDNSRPHLSSSNNESTIRNILRKNGIIYDEQKTYNDLMGDEKPLRFDFYLPKYDLLIEVDGGFHFIQTKLNDLEKQQRYDKLKNEYCKLHKIPLIRISESFIKHNIDEVYEIFETEEYLNGGVIDIDCYGKEYENVLT